MRTTRRDLIPFSFYDHTGMEKHLEKMAQKGVDAGGTDQLGVEVPGNPTPEAPLFRFLRHPGLRLEPEPRRTDHVPGVLPALGWKLAAARVDAGVLQRGGGSTAIQTDPELEVCMVGKRARRMIPAYVIFLVLGFLIGGGWCFSLVTKPIQTLTTPSGVLLGLCWLCLFLYSTVDLIAYYAWHRRALAAAQRGEFLPTRGCHELLYVALVVIALGLVYWFVVERRPGMRLLTGGLLLAYVAMFLAVNGTKQIMKRKKAPATLNRTITICVDVLLAVILVGVVNAMVIKGMQNGAFSIEKQIKASLLASDLTGVEEEKYTTTVSTEMTPFLDRQEVWCRTGFGQEEPLPGMDYTLVKLHVPFLHNACFRELCRPLEKRMATYVDGSVVHAQYVAVDPTPWGAEKATSLIWPGNFGRSTFYAGRTGSSSWERTGT